MKVQPLDSTLFGEEKENAVIAVIMNTLIIIMVIFLLFVLTFQLCRVKGSSMLPTLNDGDDLLVTNLVSGYKTNDIVIIDVDSTAPVVKRVVATAGERFMFVEETGVIHLYKSNSSGDFLLVDEPYIREPMTKSIFEGNRKFEIGKEYTVDANCILFLGDNRNNSKDSRFYGYAKTNQIIGKVVLITRPGSFAYKLLNIIFNHSMTDNDAIPSI